ncbi:MAG: 4-hydroxyphenylpyruvate dioxygenase [Asgard group archaeon]|jgi:4-hydroxyphenylpyruvate dioxygenase|nr:4-hydroxyphenylpyruvate dioxygenase [Candidatus Heimdallarchaeota archaeon]MEC8705114.1 4-hydroxyphenylpyruvate dioxygenase [Asgard group archaeon]|tara:strand:+ start:971 stop:2116 length:1146 start_codon:yes stop_codon:yes gene_type:complete
MALQEETPKFKNKSSDKNAVDILGVQDFDAVEFYVGNAYQSAYYYQRALGFKPVAWSSLKTGNRKYASYVMQQGNAKIVLTSSYEPSSEISSHQLVHGDGAKSIGLRVKDAQIAHDKAIERGAKSVLEPITMKDDYGEIRLSAIETYGDTIHKFIERDGYDGHYLPGYQPFQPILETEERGVVRIDHIVGNVNWNQMDPTVQFYHEVFGFGTFLEFSPDDINTQYSALSSKVVRNYNDRVKMPINEPAFGLKTSQIEEYINYYHAAGVQHIALSTNNIIETVKNMKSNGVEFIEVPQTYYDDLKQRVGDIKEDFNELAKHGILVDRDERGYLLQLFTKPIQDRPTFFFEVIQRRGAQGFGKGNFKALFEAIEREQSERGNL